MCTCFESCCIHANIQKKKLNVVDIEQYVEKQHTQKRMKRKQRDSSKDAEISITSTEINVDVYGKSFNHVQIVKKSSKQSRFI